MNAKGVGLGLVISEKLTKMFNGKMSLESKVGKGSKFSFTIEISKIEELIKDFVENDNEEKIIADQNKLMF
jgi:signal transduction histidine kinase